MKFLHSMIRVSNLEDSLKFYIDALGLEEVRRKEVPKGKFTLVFLKAPDSDAEIELTYNWDSIEDYGNARNFGHLAFSVDNIYDMCASLQQKGIKILRPPRDGHMAFIKSPDNISIELLQKGKPLPSQEPWASMQNSGNW
ncbi:VOC family protein [bacterium]|nr:VOC family protein [bacterium]